MTKCPSASRTLWQRPCLGALFATSILLCNGLAFAQETEAKNSSAANDRAAALAYRQALDAYAQGDLEGALDSMQRSYSLSGRAELLFNLAGLERELQHCAIALRDYEGYLSSVPNGKYRSDAEAALKELQSECPAETAPAPEPIASAPSPPVVAPAMPAVTAPPMAAPPAADTSYWTTGRLIGWSTIASGVVSGGLALYFLNAALSDRDAVAESAAKLKYTPPNPPWADDLESQHRNAHLSQALGITAGALVAGGAVLLILDPKSASSANASATVSVYPGYLGAACSGSF